MNLTARRFLSVMVLGTVAAASRGARAQVVGTGGATGTGTLADADLYVNVQRVAGTNLTDRDRALFLNRANCACGTKAFVRAVIQPSAAATALTISPSASVSMWVGTPCDPTSTVSCCHRLASIPFSQFRQTGITAETTVDILERQWRAEQFGNCGDTINPVLIGTGTGGTAGMGGAIGTGGASGTGGAAGFGGASGTGGAGTGGSTASGPTAACDGGTFSQLISLFIGTTGEGTRDAGYKPLSFSVDPDPPPALSGLTVSPVNEALQVSWTGITTAQVGDLLGYQALCTRGEFTQVFQAGTFTPGFDSCAGADGTGWPGRGTLPTSTFVCSDLLSPSATSVRIGILQNDINYFVGVAAIDTARNASVVVPQVRKPILTKDFYYEYRHGDPQGAATGGYCAVLADPGIERTAVGLALAGLLALVVVRLRHPSRRP